MTPARVADVRVTVVTGLGDPLGGVFWRAYAEAGGPPLQQVLVLRGGGGAKRYPLWQRPLVPLLMFGPGGTLRLTATRTRVPLTSRDREAGIQLRREEAWPGDPEVVVLDSLNREPGLTKLRESRPDLLVSVGPPEILKVPVLETPRLGSVNVHNGRIPRFRGHLGTFWEVFEGEAEGYVSIHEMAPRVDSGRLVAAEPIPIRRPIGFLDLMLEKKRRGGELLARLVERVEREQGLPGEVVGSGSEADSTDYFGWPSLAQLWQFRGRLRSGPNGK